jgi:quercetin dioxygenase-like cupin family protein
MQGWYIQKEKNTYIFVILKGIHGVRQDIPAVRIYYISSGEALFTIDGKEYLAGRGSVVEIPAHSTYGLSSVGDEPVIYFVDVGTRLDLDSIPST